MPFILPMIASLKKYRSGKCTMLTLTGVSDNVGGVKHVATTLPHALDQERHFALIGEVLNPTTARFLISIQVGKLSSTHASLRSQARSGLLLRTPPRRGAGCPLNYSVFDCTPSPVPLWPACEPNFLTARNSIPCATSSREQRPVSAPSLP